MNARLEPDKATDTTHPDRQKALVSDVSEEQTRDWNNAEDRYEMIAEAAYYRAEQRGFALGEEEIDWLEAEAQLLKQMSEEAPTATE